MAGFESAADILGGRACGVLCHVTSLPGGQGIGDVGRAALEFVAFLRDSGQRVWQVLPLNPTDPGTGNAPYSSRSAFATNPLLVDLGQLEEWGLVRADELDADAPGPSRLVDYPAVLAYKLDRLHRAHERFQALPDSETLRRDYAQFCEEQAWWLEDDALFSAIKEEEQGRSWVDWPEPLATRQPGALEEARARLASQVDFHRFTQFLFHRQYEALRRALKDAGILLLGDLPIYVSHDSSDVWAHREIFKLDPKGWPRVVAGVPPDYFSETGQLWGNPVYDWDACAKEGYRWWLQRMQRALDLFDLVRVDHFRGFVAYWEVPTGHRTAIHGTWVPGPGRAFFDALLARFGRLPVVAEDLGTIDDSVRQLMAAYDIPGCRVLQFAFGDDFPDNPHKPENHVENCLVYTGTHDNNTSRGWYEEEADEASKRRLEAALGHPTDPERVSWDMVELALSSRAGLAVLPVQDLLGLPSWARMNRPAVAQGNWRFRLEQGMLSDDLAHRLRSALAASGRIP